MKKKVILMVCGLLIFMSMTVLCSGNFQNSVLEGFFELETDVYEDMTEFFEEVEEALPIFKEQGKAYVQKFDEYIKECEFEEKDRKKLENKFILTMTEYSMTDDEAEYLINLIANDYDIEKVLDIYAFLRMTNSDVEMITDIYHEGEANSDKNFWIYDTYDKLLNREEDMLSVEDVAYYVGMGITVDEIVGAYELSFAGIKNTKFMLNERIDGLSWNEICAEVISENPEIIKNAPEMTIGEVLTYRGHSVKMRKDVTEIISFDEEKVYLNERAFEHETEVSMKKHELIEEFDAEVISEENVENYEYSENRNTMPLGEEYLFEEDYIPVEDAEVE